MEMGSLKAFAPNYVEPCFDVSIFKNSLSSRVKDEATM